MVHFSFRGEENVESMQYAIHFQRITALSYSLSWRIWAVPHPMEGWLDQAYSVVFFSNL
jgi:hypothetical protein